MDVHNSSAHEIIIYYHKNFQVDMGHKSLFLLKGIVILIANIVALPWCGKDNSLESQKPYLEEKKKKNHSHLLDAWLYHRMASLEACQLSREQKQVSLIYVYILKTPK